MKEPSVVKLLSEYEIHVMPLVNPDGYEYGRNNDRMWRKNRRPNTGSRCVGTDLNRNFDDRWGTVGVSFNPCDDTYPGPKANSEPETLAIIKAITSQRNKFKVFTTIHAYGQLWMLPWGGTRIKPDDYSELYTFGNLI
jgi:murein tripeptide amidase MpaA